MPVDLSNKQAANADTHALTQDLEGLGVGQVAYTRRVKVDGVFLWGVFSADGDMVAAAQTRSEALGTILQNDLEAASLH